MVEKCETYAASGADHALDLRHGYRDGPVGVPRARGRARADPRRPHDAVDRHRAARWRPRGWRAATSCSAPWTTSTSCTRSRWGRSRSCGPRSSTSGRCSLEVGVRVYAENARHRGAGADAVNSHLVFVKVDEHVKPRAGAADRRAARAGRGGAASRRRGERRAPAARALRAGAPSAAARCEDDAPEELRWRFESCRSVLPEDTLFGNTMFPGKLLHGHRRGGRHPLDALLPGPRHDGVPGRARLLRADLDARGRHVQGGPEPRRHARRSRSASRC